MSGGRFPLTVTVDPGAAVGGDTVTGNEEAAVANALPPGLPEQGD